MRIHEFISFYRTVFTMWAFRSAYGAGAALHVVALGFAPASVLSPMNSLGLIANAVASAVSWSECCRSKLCVGQHNRHCVCLKIAASGTMPTLASRRYKSIDC